MKRFELALLIALVFTITLSLLDFSHRSNGISNQIFRLHILANSDSEYDQKLKLNVRDNLLKAGRAVLDGSGGIDGAILRADENLDSFRQVAEQTLRRNGSTHAVTARVSRADFGPRAYGDITLPAGRYNALIVEIGAAAGENWWCVMYPSLCLSAAAQSISGALNGRQAEMVEDGQRFVVKFRIIEFFQNIRNAFS